MSRLSPLPKGLRYLRPFRREVARLKPEEIDESLNLTLLNKLLLGRIAGIPVEAGKSRLQDDHAILEEWLAAPNLTDNGGMTFLHGYLMALPELVDRLLEQNERPHERVEVEMDFPPEAKVKRLGGERGWMASWARSKFHVFPTDKNGMRQEIERFRADESSGHPLIKSTLAPVAFGDAKGVKCLKDASIVESMQAEYVLEVPGGFVSAVVVKGGNRIDGRKFKEYEAKFEKFFHTLRVVRIPK